MGQKSFGFRPNLLLIEDDRQSAEPLARLLEFCGYRVEMARDAAMARDAYNSRSFDYVLSDLTLPDGDGCELLSELLRSGPTTAIALTGWDQDEVGDRCKNAGFLALLMKPIEIRHLLKVLHGLMGKRSVALTHRVLTDPNGEKLSSDLVTPLLRTHAIST